MQVRVEEQDPESNNQSGLSGRLREIFSSLSIPDLNPDMLMQLGSHTIHPLLTAYHGMVDPWGAIGPIYNKATISDGRNLRLQLTDQRFYFLVVKGGTIYSPLNEITPAWARLITDKPFSPLARALRSDQAILEVKATLSLLKSALDAHAELLRIPLPYSVRQVTKVNDQPIEDYLNNHYALRISNLTGLSLEEVRRRINSIIQKELDVELLQHSLLLKSDLAGKNLPAIYSYLEIGSGVRIPDFFGSLIGVAFRGAATEIVDSGSFLLDNDFLSKEILKRVLSGIKHSAIPWPQLETIAEQSRKYYSGEWDVAGFTRSALLFLCQNLDIETDRLEFPGATQKEVFASFREDENLNQYLFDTFVSRVLGTMIKAHTIGYTFAPEPRGVSGSTAAWNVNTSGTILDMRSLRNNHRDYEHFRIMCIKDWYDILFTIGLFMRLLNKNVQERAFVRIIDIAELQIENCRNSIGFKDIYAYFFSDLLRNDNIRSRRKLLFS